MEGTSSNLGVYTAPEGQAVSGALLAELNAIHGLRGWWSHKPPWIWPDRLLIQHAFDGTLGELTARVLQVVSRYSQVPAGQPRVTSTRVRASSPQMVIGSMPYNPFYRMFAVNQTFVGGHCGPGKNTGLFFSDEAMQGDPEITGIADRLRAIPGIHPKCFSIEPEGVSAQAIDPDQWTEVEPLVRELILSHLSWPADVPVHRVNLPYHGYED
jgi:hypothetical protein